MTGRVMIFSELACFSPSVEEEIRKLWVNNGGRLTHTEADFRKADFFFCNGMQDPWLKELRARSLIVRHAAWVTLCAMEQFRMPVALYTLDEGFNESEITITDRQLVSQNPKLYPDPGLNRKRPLEEPSTECQPPSKKARVDETRKQAIGPIHEHRSSGQPYTHNMENLTENPPAYLRHRSLTTRITGRKAGKVSQTVKLFESKISQPKFVILSPPITPKKLVQNATGPGIPSGSGGHRPSSLNRHTLFWNDLLARSHLGARSNETRNGVLTLTMEELLDAPRVRGSIFTVNHTFLGKEFINRDYA